MNTTHTFHRSPVQQALRGLAALALAGAPLFGLAANGYLPAGEFDVDAWIQGNQAQHAVVAIEDTVRQEPAIAMAPTEATQVAQVTRQHVREQLQQAQDAGMMTGNGEVGDSEAVLQAREDFNQAQTEMMLAAMQAENERVLAEMSRRENELRIAEAYAPGEFIVEYTGEDESFEAVPMVWMADEPT